MSESLSDALYGDGAAQVGEESILVNAVAGFTKAGFTSDYLVIVNVLPGEEMFSAEEVAEFHPPVGELIVDGQGHQPVVDSRHVEAHVYDRETGLPLTSPVPTIEVIDNFTGQTTLIESVLMQDVIVGETDIHFGDNVVLAGDTDLRIRVIIGPGNEVIVDGHLN